MFNDKSFESRLSAWSGFRSSLEKSDTPLHDVVSYYSQTIRVSQRYDPWDQANWPTPWTLVFENKYCAFTAILGMCYSLKLTNRFKESAIDVCIIKDDALQTQYVGRVNEYILGLNDDVHLIDDISNRISILKEFTVCNSIH